MSFDEYAAGARAGLERAAEICAEEAGWARDAGNFHRCEYLIRLEIEQMDSRQPAEREAGAEKG